jgi:hypothetical protein
MFAPIDFHTIAELASSPFDLGDASLAARSRLQLLITS